MIGAGMGQCGFCLCDRGCLCGSSVFWHAVISRVLESRGYRVGIISSRTGKIRRVSRSLGSRVLVFLYLPAIWTLWSTTTVYPKTQKDGCLYPWREMGRRPDYACVVYGNLIRRTYKKTPVILGGIEASLRRLAHYDYWSDRLKRSILLDSGRTSFLMAWVSAPS